MTSLGLLTDFSSAKMSGHDFSLTSCGRGFRWTAVAVSHGGVLIPWRGHGRGSAHGAFHAGHRKGHPSLFGIQQRIRPRCCPVTGGGLRRRAHPWATPLRALAEGWRRQNNALCLIRASVGAHVPEACSGTLCPASAIEELGLERSPRASSPPALNESDLLMTARDAASHSSEAASLYLDEMTLDQLHDDLVQLARNYGRIAPAEAYQTGTTLLNQVQVLLDRTRSPQQHTKLYYAAAQASALLSALSFDLGALVPALTFARSSAQYGKTIENGSVQAYAHGLMALVAFWDSRPARPSAWPGGARSSAAWGHRSASPVRHRGPRPRSSARRRASGALYPRCARPDQRQ